MKQFKFITTGAMFALLLAGCADDDLVKKSVVPPVSGDEIEFGAAPGGFTDVDPTTRTIYDVPEGSTFDNYTLLNIKWQYDIDQVRVYCPEGAEGFRTADYTVTKATDTSTESTGFLVKNGETSVRWGDTNTLHNFYAFYSLGKIDNGLQTGTKVTATIPTGQEGGQLLSYNNDGTVSSDGTGPFKIITPDMSFCMMAGKGIWEPGTDKNVALTFTPIVTVLDVLVNGPSDDQAGGIDVMKIVSVSVRSKSGQNIVGTFSYDLAKEEYDFSATDGSQTANSIATVQTIDPTTNNPVEVGVGQQLNVKFFLLPREIADGDLVVSVFTEGGVVYNKTISGVGTTTDGTGDGKLGAGLITRIKTPKLGGQTANNWMSQVPDNALFSQLSLPGSKHSYANTVDESFDPNTGLSNFYQALPVAEILSGEDATTTQFDEGIRAFDIHLDLDANSTTANPIVYAGGHPISVAGGYYKLSEALTALKNKLYPVDETPTECAVVLLNFVYNMTSSEFTWLNAVVNALDSWNTSNPNVLAKLDANSTMSAMRGQIAVIVNWRLDANESQGGQTISSIIGGREYINYITGFSTSVQNIDLVTAPYSSGASVRIQNLQQCNNPEITDPGDFGYRSGIGLVPYFITKANSDDPTVNCNLIETKKNLMHQLNQEIVDGGGNLYINDLSGFCVTKNEGSTGYITYRKNVRGDWNVLWNYGDETKLYDFTKLPTDGKFYSSSAPENPSGGDVWYQYPMVDQAELGNGGNTCLFAETFNAVAVDEYTALVGDLRQSLGIVLMNFAGVAEVKGSQTYQVQGVRLPGLIMMNNFMYPLKTGTTTAESSSAVSYSKGGDVWD